MDKKYEYFVSYAHTCGFGNTLWILPYEINSYECFQRFYNEFKEVNKNEITSFAILNFIKLREIPAEQAEK